MPKSKARKKKAPREIVRCRYCGMETKAPRVQRYETTTYVPTDQPGAPAGARWPHSPKATNPPPLCREAEVGQRAMLSALIPDGSWTDR